MTDRVKVTLDTNILIYAIDSSQGSKHLLAGKLLLRAAASRQPIMLQSLNEFSAVVRRKHLMSLPALRQMIDFHCSTLTVEHPVIDDLLQALQAQEDHKLAFWDAMLWACARRSGCKILFSEDFQDGRELGGVRFINPFKLTRHELQSLNF
ncbi:MAG: PIN domain-containing protein [Acidobacteriota bacterium]|nr:PIN domain-containing protein [Acidobacteriota bacterium]